jgi:hypothetical protein
MDPALANLLGYFEALERFDIEQAASYFTEDVIYHHPPFRFSDYDESEEGGWHKAVGREALLRLWRRRGPQDAQHHVTAFARNGDMCFNEAWGTLEGNDQYVSFVSVFRVADDDRIAEYLSYTNHPRLPTLGATVPLRLAD